MPRIESRTQRYLLFLHIENCRTIRWNKTKTWKIWMDKVKKKKQSLNRYSWIPLATPHVLEFIEANNKICCVFAHNKMSERTLSRARTRSVMYSHRMCKCYSVCVFFLLFHLCVCVCEFVRRGCWFVVYIIIITLLLILTRKSICYGRLEHWNSNTWSARACSSFQSCFFCLIFFSFWNFIAIAICDWCSYVCAIRICAHTME